MESILVKGDTKLSDLKVGDLVMTAEIGRITKIGSGSRRYQDKGTKTAIYVVDVKPRCSTCKQKPCNHERIMTIGWGQQECAKIIKINR